MKSVTWLYISLRRKSRIDKITNSFLHQSSYYRAVDTARDSSYDLSFLTNELADTSDRVLDEVAHDPALLSLADTDGKVLQQFYTEGSVRDFGVKLDSYDASSQIV